MDEKQKGEIGKSQTQEEELEYWEREYPELTREEILEILEFYDT